MLFFIYKGAQNYESKLEERKDAAEKVNAKGV